MTDMTLGAGGAGGASESQPSDFGSDIWPSGRAKEPLGCLVNLAQDLARKAQDWLRREGLTAARP